MFHYRSFEASKMRTSVFLLIIFSFQIWVAASNGATEKAGVVRHEDALIYFVVARKQACM